MMIVVNIKWRKTRLFIQKIKQRNIQAYIIIRPYLKENDLTSSVWLYSKRQRHLYHVIKRPLIITIDRKENRIIVEVLNSSNLFLFSSVLNKILLFNTRKKKEEEAVQYKTKMLTNISVFFLFYLQYNTYIAHYNKLKD